MEFPRLCPARLLSDQSFGSYMTPHDYMFPFYDMNYYRPWKWFTQSKSKEFGSTIENEKGNYKITLDVQNFRPNEISVKVTEKEVIIEANHEERADTHGYVARQFRRRYALPSHCSSENVTSTLSPDGVLTVIAAKTLEESEKIVPIKMCGPSATRNYIVKEATAETSQKEAVNDTIKTANKSLSQDEHSRLFKPELLKDAEKSSDMNGAKAESKTIELLKTSTHMGASSTGAAKSLLEESMKSNLDTSELGKMVQKNSGMSGPSGKLCQKSLATEMSEIKSISQRTEESSSFKSMSSSTKTGGKKSEYLNEVISAELREAAENM